MIQNTKELDKEKTEHLLDKDLDILTGIYNLKATEEKVNESIARCHMGTMLFIGIDNFKAINSRYGHIMGDSLLKTIVQMLSKMVFKNDILGRISGDEFVIFMPVEQSMEFVEERGHQIKDRLKELTVKNRKITKISITAGGSLYQEGDDYQSMSLRAAGNFIEDRKKQKEKEMEDTKNTAMVKKGIAMDMKLICAEMSEQQLIPGAYCQDYETFKSIYRFVERRMRRTNGSAFIILFTLTDPFGEFLELDGREDKITTLKNVIQNSLRMGDVFTMYSSCQYLVMVSDVEAEDADRIAERIHREFYRQLPGNKEDLLLHHSYPMKPAGGELDFIP